jgi:uncharacterized lipoprotein YbaY
MLAVTSVTLVATLGSGLEEVVALAGCTFGTSTTNAPTVDTASKIANTATHTVLNEVILSGIVLLDTA